MAEVAENLPEKPTIDEKKLETPIPIPISKTCTSEEVEEVSKTEEVSKAESDIIRQIEYYFGDANLNRDKFLLEQISKDEEGWVPLSVLLTFKRLSSLTTDEGVIVNALQKSDEGLIEISDDKTKIRRHPERPIPEHNEERRKEISSRTAYAKGFPLDAEMSDLIEFFDVYDKVLNITMRKFMDKSTKTYKFKGSVFVTFAKKEQCEKFVSKEKVEYKGTELIRKWQEHYFEEKKVERDLKKKSKSKPEPPEEVQFKLPKGAVLHFDNVSEDTTREHIREAVEELEGDIAYIDFCKGDQEGYIRLNNENSAQPFLDKVKDKKLKLNHSTELVLRTLTDDEEKEFLKKVIDHMKSRRINQNKHKGGNRKRRGGDNRDRSDGEPHAKKESKNE